MRTLDVSESSCAASESVHVSKKYARISSVFLEATVRKVQWWLNTLSVLMAHFEHIGYWVSCFQKSLSFMVIFYAKAL